MIEAQRYIVKSDEIYPKMAINVVVITWSIHPQESGSYGMGAEEAV